MGELIASFFEKDSTLRMRRVSSFPQHIPSAKPQELIVLPGIERVVAEALELMR